MPTLAVGMFSCENPAWPRKRGHGTHPLSNMPAANCPGQFRPVLRHSRPSCSRLSSDSYIEGSAMVAKTARVFSACLAMLVLLAGVRPAVGEGWSILHPLTFGSTSDAKPKQPVMQSQPTQKPPSTFSQIVAAPGNLATKVGNTITGKKPEPVKAPAAMYARPTPPVIAPPPKKESKSWVSSWFQPEEPKKPKSVSDWMGQPRVDQ
jgi:hypothetical protein